MPGQAEQASGELVCLYTFLWMLSTTQHSLYIAAVPGWDCISTLFNTERGMLSCMQSRGAPGFDVFTVHGSPLVHHMQVSFGESHKVVGGHPSLGDWDVSNAPQMQWNDGNVWTLEVQLPAGSDIEFKVTVKSYMSGHTCIYD